MTEKVTANPSSGGESFAVDVDVLDATIKWPYAKLAIGADGSQTPVDGSNPVPVTGTISTGLTQPLTNTELRASAVPISGTVTANTGLAQPLTDTQLRAAAVPVSGTFFQATQPVSLASAPLPTDAATATNQAIGNASLSAIDSKLGGTLTVNTGLTDTQLRASAVPVSGTFYPATQPISGTVSVDNFPATQAVSGTFWQATQPVSLVTVPLATDAATETTLSAMSAKLSTASADHPQSYTPSLPVRQSPQKLWDWSFAKAVSNNVDTTKGTVIRTGSGQTVNQTGGNLVITAGTTANAETVIRTLESWNGALTMWEATTLSQRIANNNFFLELVDVIGDGLAYNIVSTTLVDVTKTAHGFTADNIGQRIDLCALSSVGVPMEGVIQSIPDADTIRFTVAGWPASGSGTLSLTGWNKIELNYTSTTATNTTFNTRRQGYQNSGSVTATVFTTATGHMAAVNVSCGVASLADQVLTSAGVLTNRTAWKLNVPEQERELYYQIRCKNGTSNPATGTTWTLGMLRVEDYIPQQVELTGTRQQSIGSTLPVNVTVMPTTTVTGTVNATNTPVTPTTTFTNSAASTNGTVIKGSAGTLWNITATNINAAVRYLKLYNSTTVTVGTTTPVLTLAIPAGGVVNIIGGANGMRFATGICLGITTGAADTDTGAVAASEIKVATAFT